MVDVVGLNPREKLKLVVYQLKYVAQVLFMQWTDERPLREGPVFWEVFKVAFIDRFFPLELREINLVKLMNLRLGGMIVKDYSLKFT